MGKPREGGQILGWLAPCNCVQWRLYIVCGGAACAVLSCTCMMGFVGRQCCSWLVQQPGVLAEVCPQCPPAAPSSPVPPALLELGHGCLSQKFQEAPGRWGAPALGLQLCPWGRGEEEKPQPVPKDVRLFTIKAVSQRQPDRAAFTRHSRTLEGLLPIAPHTERERAVYVVSGRGERKKRS